MTRFLTKELEDTFATISMDYTYKCAHQFEDRIRRGIYTTSANKHCNIMLHLMGTEDIPYDEEAQESFENGNACYGASRLAELGDMIFHNSYGISVLYCPKELTEYQKLRLRLWHEYFEIVKMEYEISTQGKDLYEKEDINTYLKENRILDDDYIQSLTLKYPDYKEQ